MLSLDQLYDLLQGALTTFEQLYAMTLHENAVASPDI